MYRNWKRRGRTDSGKRATVLRRMFLVILTAVIVCLTGCETPVQEETASTQQKDREKEYPTLSWWLVGSTPEDYQVVMEHVNDYLEEKLQIHLELHFVDWGSWPETSSALINNREYFDLMFVDVTSFNQFASLGALQDITDLLHSYAPSLWGVMPEKVWSGARLSGRIYAVPTYKDSALCQYWVFDAYYLDKYGFSVEELDTWEKLDQYFRAIKAGEGSDFYPIRLSRGENMDIFNEYDSFTCGLRFIGVDPDDPKRQVVCVLEDEEILQKLSYLHKWYLDGLINPDANQLENLEEPRLFFQSVGWPGAEAVWQQTEGIEKVVTRVSFGPVYSRDSIQGAMTAISVQSKYKKQALQLLELINTDHKLRDMLAYGMENRNFVYVKENVVRRLNNDWDVAAYAQGTFFNMSVLEENSEKGWEGLKENNEKAKESVLLDFEIDMHELGVEVEACKRIWDEYVMELTTGAVDPDVAVPECLEQMRRSGLDIIISEAQKQIDTYYGQNGS